MDPNSAMGKYLKEYGPGVYHLAFGVDDIQQSAKDLLAKGVKLRGENGLTQSADGYYTANTDPATSLGVAFQLAQG